MRVVEFGSLGPGPFAAMLLADLGAQVIRVDRPPGPSGARGFTATADARLDLLNRGRRSVVLDLARPGAADAALHLVERADALIEGFRPGVMERLGLGPDPCLRRQPRLVYGRMTGWGQDGPRSTEAGHDIGYIALTGALHAIGPTAGPPPRRSTWSATSAAAACCWWSGCSPRCWRPGSPAAARWSTRRSWTARAC